MVDQLVSFAKIAAVTALFIVASAYTAGPGIGF